MDQPQKRVRQPGRAYLLPAELRALRSYLGLTQAALAKLVGVTRRTVNRWERLPLVGFEAEVLDPLPVVPISRVYAKEIYRVAMRYARETHRDIEEVKRICLPIEPRG